MWGLFIKYTNRIILWITMLFLLIMVVSIFLQIVSRVLISSSFTWTEELSRFLMIWVIFLGAGFSFQSGAHVGVEFFVERLPKKFQKATSVLILIISIIFLLVMLIKGIELCERTMNQTSTALNIPMGIVYLVFPISAVLMIVNIIDVFVKRFRSNELIKGE